MILTREIYMYNRSNLLFEADRRKIPGEKQRPLLRYLYINFEEAFDIVWQEDIWKVLAFFGFPNKIIQLLKALYS